jgi:putative transposase
MATYALTTGTYQRRVLLVRTTNAELLIDVMFRYRDQGRYKLHGFAVMPEHLHVLLTPSTGQTIQRCAQFIKDGFSYELRAEFRGQVWQPGFYEHRIRDCVDFRNQLEYIAANPMRRGLSKHGFVHSRYLERLDPMPMELGGLWMAV